VSTINPEIEAHLRERCRVAHAEGDDNIEVYTHIVLSLLGRAAPAVALSVEQRDAIEEAICWARDDGLPGTADMLRSVLTAQPDFASVLPAEVIAWRDAYQGYLDASERYNAHLKYVRENCPFGTNVDDQYQALEAAKRKQFQLIGPMFSAVSAKAAGVAIRASGAAPTPGVFDSHEVIHGTHIEVVPHYREGAPVAVADAKPARWEAFEMGFSFRSALLGHVHDGRDVGRLTACEFWHPSMLGMHVGTDLHVGLTVGEATVRLKGEIRRRLDGFDAALPSQAAPAHAAAERHGLDTAERVCFYEQDFYVLSNFGSFNLKGGYYGSGHSQGIMFATSEHAYHWHKFAPTNSDIADQILAAASAHEAFKIAERNKALRWHEWDRFKVEIMRDILRAKATQHEYVLRKLLATGDRELVENSWRDDYWGWGPNHDGQNMLGKLWMEVRTELRTAAAAKGESP